MSAAGALVCAGALAALLWAERTGRPRLRAVAKMTAAAGFLFAAIAGGALATGYGRWITAGLALGAAGDAALLGHGTRAVAAGMGLFGLGHVCYLAACATRVPPADWLGPHAAAPLALGLAAMVWLWPHAGKLRAPAAAYVALFATVVTAAWAPLLRGGAGGGAGLLAAGASAFFLSDLAVARQRFVARSFWNKAWGLPLYLGGQLLIALSAAQ
ncbi:MAG TPA: lysoplasmalogenase family protein [Kofleriaceae bacterium]|nr:lysoplasmalogenase family protein [Kofleriaceae bacterium]